MNTQRIIAATDVAETLKGMLDGMEHDRLFVLTDEHTEQWCYPLVAPVVGEAHRISIAAGDDNKDIEALCHVWDELSGHGATRHSLLINLGGGMVTDLGGFAAATFKRGIRCINVPTTLLAMVDAAVGGKTGINRHALKNEVGAFYPAEAVVVSAQFLHTLDAPNIASGFAEMLKHGLISTEEHWSRLMRYDLNGLDLDALQGLIMESISVKEHIVEQDPTEKHIRKALNLGHTLGHAFETWAMRHAMPILHGHAVAWGLIGELYLAHIHEGFPTDKLRQMVSYVKEVYEPIAFTCKDYEELHELMQHDKKNRGTEIRFTLLGGIGDIRIDCIATKEEIDEALDFVREC
jgi:3-dehydroquinate synthase